MKTSSSLNRRGVLLVSFLFALFVDLFGGIDAWTGSETLQIHDVTVDPGGATVYLSTYQGLFKTEDDGYSVTALNRGLPSRGIDSLAIDPSNPSRLWVTVNYEGLFQSTNGGRNWTKITAGSVKGLAALTVDPSAPDTLYAIDSEGSVTKSTNAGKGWARIFGSESNPIVSLAVSPDGSRILAGGNGVWSSSDKGQTWEKKLELPENIRANSILFHPTLQSTLFVGAGGVYKSTDSGQTWHVSTEGLMPTYDPWVGRLFASPHDPSLLLAFGGGGLHRSSDGGETWRLLRKGLAEAGGSSLAADPSRPGVFYLGTNRGLYVSIDAGVSWHPAHRSIDDFTLASLIVSPDSKAFFALDSNTVKRSTDGGYTWIPIDTGLPGDGEISDFQVDPADPQKMYVALVRGEGFYRTMNGGISWDPMGGIPAEKSEYQEWQISIDPFDGRRLFAARTRESSWHPLIMLRSTDRGDSWAPLSLGEVRVGPMRTRVVFDQVLPGVIYISTNSGVFRSDNYGNSWTAAPDQPITGEPYSLVADPHQAGVLYAGYESGSIYKSTNGGTSWKLISATDHLSPVSSIVVSPHDSRRLYALKFGYGVFTSDDGGASWRQVDYYHVPLVFDPLDSKMMYGGGFWKSTDAGRTWRRLRRDLRDLHVSTTIIDPRNGDVAYGLTWDESGPQSVYKTTDGGRTWAATDSGLGTNPWGLVMHPLDSQRLWCSALDGLYQTRNGGANWERVSDRFMRRVVLDPGNLDIIYAIDTEDALLKSTDAGRTWAGIADMKVDYLALSYSTPITLFALDYTALKKSTDSGKTWTQASLPPLGNLHISGFLVDPDDPEVIRVAGYPPGPPGLPDPNQTLTIFETRDGGQTWTELQQPIPEWPGYDPHNPQVRYLTNAYSLDGGTTWTQLDPPPPYWSFFVSSTQPPKLYAPSEKGIYLLTPSDERTLYFPQVAVGKSGKGQLHTEISLLNTGNETVAYLDFFSRDGNPMQVRLRGLDLRSSFELTLAPSQTMTLETESDSELQVGYLRMQAGTGVQGSLVYSYTESGVRLFEASVAAATATRGSTFFLDFSHQGDNTALALVNTGDGKATTTIRLYDSDYKLVASQSLDDHIESFEPGHQVSLLATDLFPLITGRDQLSGIITVESDQPLAALGLLQHSDANHPFPIGNTTLTMMPTVAGLPETGTGQVFFPRLVYLPQIAAGQNGPFLTRSSLFAVNMGSSAVRVDVSLFDRDHNPMALQVEGIGQASSFNFALEKGQSKVLTLASDEGQKAGYAVVRFYGNVTISARLDSSLNDLDFFRTGVPAVGGLKRFALLVRAGDADGTAFSLVNTGRREAGGTLALRDASGSVIGQRQLSEIGPLRPGYHEACYVSEIFFDELSDVGVFEGSLWIESDQPLAAVTLRQHDDPLLPFPLDVFLLTVFPIMPF